MFQVTLTVLPMVMGTLYLLSICWNAYPPTVMNGFG